MTTKLLTLLTLGGLIFILIGDTLLPKPLSTWSYNTRNAINTTLVQGFNPKMKKPSRRRENQVNQLEKQVEGTDNEDKK